MNVTHFIEENYKKFPSREAIGFKKEEEWKSLSWADFRRMVYKTANALKQYGIKSGERVGIYSDNSAEWMVFDLAIMALGGVSVPLYSTASRDQVRYILNDCHVRVLLTGNQEQYDLSYELLNEEVGIELLIAAKKKIWIKKDRSHYLEDFIKEGAEEFSVEPREEDDLATLIYTSGTTGVPKGVMLTHGNFNQNINSHFEFFKFKNFTSEHSLAFLPLTHVFERSWSLLCLKGGAKVSFLENTKLIASALTEVRPTMMCAVPRFYQKIYVGVHEAMEKGPSWKKNLFGWALKQGKTKAEYSRQGKNIPFGLSLKAGIAETLVFKKIKEKMGGRLWFMPCGGASISVEVSEFFEAIGAHLTVGYGLTETTATVSAMPLEGYVLGSSGKVLGGTEIKIGENDEILVRGTGVMKGYFNREEETRAVLDEKGWLRTGDAGKIVDGHLFITDRIKDLMKTSNGKYIAPQPIENLLSDQALISNAVIVAEDKPFVSALIVPDFENMKNYLSSLGLEGKSPYELVNSSVLHDKFKEILDSAQKNLQGFEKVKKFILLPKDFEIESGEMTPTLKVRRSIVLKRYENEIAQLYHS